MCKGCSWRAFPHSLAGKTWACYLSTMDTLIARKRLLYPQVREYILTHHLSFVDNRVTLTVGTAPVPETIQRRSP